ncbi:uncharacterized protein A1O9_06740 [Exophiala aquamarina CBS 119918]|uniref:Alpha/beta hydrolase fold-3 domain-containing protein n=1 Tax=Exophiala aquamarina CBS 119918 TaxID=1182545 RepID=A0A072P9V8_9EURO|nr:uncharacterized protein A1O9_06740 [Exophiala aquamarina CBS 119918]KEF56552.1 hypothetical protein A1O9_06740 [Exophiala aquamarina CBS 119918]
MDITPVGLFHAYALQLPSLTLNTLLAAVGYSENRTHQDFLTELITLWARPALCTPAALLKSQRVFSFDYGVWGRMWISKWTLPVDQAPIDTVREQEELVQNDTKKGNSRAETGMSLQKAVEVAMLELGGQNSECKRSLPLKPSMPNLHPVQTEWTAYRRNVSNLAIRPDLSEKEMYKAMMEDTDASGPTILYFHGGAHCLMDPVTHRWPTSMLSQKSDGRVLSVRYRLAPQHIFPAALLDALSAYLALIAPPQNAFHEAVSPSQIVLAGDSSGGGLAASLLLLLQTLCRHKHSVAFHDKVVTIPDPVCAGLAVTSPWLDITRSLPSTRVNARWDIIAPPPPIDQNPTPAFPPDAIWPVSPPRVETYCSAQVCIHPLVSPLAAQRHHWRGVPPVYVSVGWEGMQDEAEVFARRVFGGDPDRQIVIFDGYEGMPHCFAMFPWNWAGRKAMEKWAEFSRNVVQTAAMRRTDVGTWTNSKTKEVKEIRLSDLALSSAGCWYQREQLHDHVVDARLEKGRKWRIDLESEILQQWKRERNHSVIGGVQ